MAYPSIVQGAGGSDFWLPNRKPLGQLQLDPDEATNFLMTDCVVFNQGGGPPVNVAAPWSSPTLTGTPNMAAIPGDFGGYATGGTGYNVPNGSFVNTSAQSWRMILYPVSWPGGFTVIIDSVGRPIIITLDTSGNTSFIQFGSSVSGTAFTGVVAGALSDLVVTYDGSTSFVFYRNGVQQTTGSSSGTSGSTADIALGTNPSTGGSNADVVYLLFQRWQRVLTAAEVQALYFSPYRGLMPANMTTGLFGRAAAAADTLFAQAWM